ncbi:MAG TPA: leucine-rich repeat protein [Candidatus Aphodocola excrementigallinarum]|uniref:Leucine-rich repeat protein n=1 Tax=Candidatus Aphodocola excrementigallinarum TaxID=2840670 RepID=A0A9D1LIS1_9FIRM|nr:leucine-rich repeat protein [Candidatus Aphodocola excrementigallinarum]
MKKAICAVILVLIGMFAGVITLQVNRNQKNIISKEEKVKELINISSLSDEFMDNYYEDYTKMVKEDNLDNVLIVISENGIKNDYGATNIVKAPNNQYFLQYKTEKERKNAYEKLKNDDRYVSVEENQTISVTEDNNLLSNENATTYNSWGIEAMGLDYAIDESNKLDLPEVTVAIIDSGLDVKLFNENYPNKLSGVYNAMENTNDINDVRDDLGHGTHIAGTIGEGTPNNVKILAIKVGTNIFYTTNTINALNYILYNEKADVINMSYGSFNSNTSTYQTIEALKQKNIISVAGTGNDDSGNKFYPAAYDNTIATGSIDSNKQRAVNSNYGTTVDFASPGVNILSINGVMSGTSMATPHATSAVATIKSYNKDISFEDTFELLKSTTDDLGDYGWDQYYGYGLINFRNKEFCDGNNCDEYNVFKDDETNITDIIKIETTDTYIPSYNYGNITNLMGAKINIYYSDSEYVTKTLGELDDVEISGYNAEEDTIQNVIINYKNKQATLVVNNENSNEKGYRYEKVDEENIRIVEFLSDGAQPNKVYIPEQIDNYNVISLGDNLFENNDFISSIVIPSSVVEIGNNTFKNANIKTIDMKADSISVGNYAFYGLKELKTIRSTINSLGDYSFANCYSLDNIKLSDDLKEIGAYSFFNDHNLENINIPSGVTSIGKYAFSSTKISSVTIPNTMTEIKEGTFLNCYSLSSVTIPNGVKNIGEYAFQKTIITSLNIPASVEYITSTSFSDITILSSIVVDKNNDFYRSEDDNLIENSTNKLVIGTAKNSNAEIPKSVKIIGERAFAAKTTIDTITIPDGVEKIETYAFYHTNVKEIIVPKSVKTFEEKAFSSNVGVVIWVYYNSPAMQYVQGDNKNYKTIDPYKIDVELSKKEYNAFDTVDTTGIKITAYYYDKNKDEETKTRTETYNSGYTIEYANASDGFRYGDDHFIISVVNNKNYTISKDVSVNVLKLKPIYTIPTDIKAKRYQKLSEIQLPEGFEWMNGDETITEVGVQTFKVKFIPKDTENYEIVENIDINVLVENVKINIIPDISLENKVYDNTYDYPQENIKISNIDSNDYTIISSTTSEKNVGDTNVTIKLKLTDEKFENYSFDNGMQEKEFNLSSKIIPKKLIKPTKSDKIYSYTGKEITFDIVNYDKTAMNLTNNKGINAGEYETIISLNSNNYIWEDDTNEDIILKFKIEKAKLNVIDNSVDKTILYDGKEHALDLDLKYNDDVIIKYIDSNNEYTLDEIPKYSEVGTYVIKYKLYVDNNYTEYYGEKILTIQKNVINNNTIDYEGLYDGKDHSIKIDVDVSDYDIKYSVNNTDYDLTELPTFTEAGEYIVNYKITLKGYNDLVGSNKVKIYGIVKLDSQLQLKDNILLVRKNDFDDLTNKITLYAKSSKFTHYDINKNSVNDIIKTGDSIEININEEKDYLYQLSLLGDVNGDGKISSADYVKIRKHIMQTELIKDDLYFYSADINNDDKISSADYVKIRKYIMNGEEL